MEVVPLADEFMRGKGNNLDIYTNYNEYLRIIQEKTTS